MVGPSENANKYDIRIAGQVKNGDGIGAGERDDEGEHLTPGRRPTGLEADDDRPPVDHQATVGAMRLHYLDWGEPGTVRPDLVFLHGGGLTAHSWGDVCRALRGRNRCLALDQRGHGDSEWSLEGDYSYPAYGADLEGLLDQLDARRCVLVGHSLGGLNAIAYGAEHPELKGIVLVDSGPRLEAEATTRIRSRMTADARFPSLAAMVEQARGDRRPTDPARLERGVVENARRHVDGHWTWKYDARIKVGDTPQGLAARERLIESVPLIAPSTLVIRGGRSRVLTDKAVDELVALLPDGRRATVPDSGHNVHRDNPVALAAAIASFLDEIGA
jgi:pimeloyl-ACP methyl ester carboxylesterase